MGGVEDDPRVTDLGYGGGDFHPDTGLWDWYEDVPDLARGGAKALRWTEVFDQWVLVEGDFARYFRIDLEDELPRRSWRWFRVRVTHLLNGDTALRNHFRTREDVDPA